MRTSLLLAREPFGRILCDTLAAYWLARTGKEYHVEWQDNNPGPQFSQHRSMQVWFGNIYLNFFAVSYAPDEAFAPLRQEYIRSVNWWRRWPQRAYVNYAMSSAGRQRLAQAAIAVWPGVHDAHDCIILGGNRRLRLLQPTRRTTTVVLKRGFPREYLTVDVQTRLAAGAELSCAPRIGRHSIEDGWYEEEWVAGVPVNRLAPHLSRAAVETAHLLLATQLVRPSLRVDSARDYLESVNRRLAVSLQILRGADIELSRKVQALHEGLIGELRRAGVEGGTTLLTAITHGDFQSANLLWDGATVRLIDWENCRRRPAHFDMLSHAVGMTTRVDWARSFAALLVAPPAQLPAYRREWPGMEWNGACRKVNLGLFLVEQLATALEEDCERVFFESGRAFHPRLPQFYASLRELANA